MAACLCSTCIISSTVRCAASLQAMLSQSWQQAPPEPEEGQEPPPPPPSFNPAAPEYNVRPQSSTCKAPPAHAQHPGLKIHACSSLALQAMAKRLSKSAPLLKYNSLMLSIRELENDLQAFEKLREKDRDEKVREAKQAQLDADKAALAETEAALAELRASYTEDPLSLVPWMGCLFGLADAGLTTFDVSGPFFPHTNLRALFNGDNSSSVYSGAESVLGTFKRRWVCLSTLTRPLCSASRPLRHKFTCSPQIGFHLSNALR